MKNPYEILGLTEETSFEELRKRYEELKAEYGEGRFQPGEAGTEAARKLNELEQAWYEIQAKREAAEVKKDAGGNDFAYVDKLIKEQKYDEAQAELDAMTVREGEWHYFQSIIYYKREWLSESKKQLEIAMQMDPSNEKYKTAYNKLVDKIKSDSDKSFSSYSGERNGKHYRGDEAGAPQMGGDSCIDWCCQMAICNIALNCCCNSCH